MSNYMPSATIHRNIVKTTPPLLKVIAHDDAGLYFDGTLRLNITHTYGATPVVNFVRAGRRNPVVLVNRSTDLVEIEFASLVVGTIEFNDTDSIITVTIK